MTIKIEKEVQAPPPFKYHRYPFKGMAIGDSFMVSYDDMPLSGTQSVRTAAYHAGKRIGAKFTSKHVDGGVRVWRIA